MSHTLSPVALASQLVDGCLVCEARRAGAQLPDDDLDPTRVYVTTDRDYASLFANGYPLGALYRVEVDELPTDLAPDPVPSWGVPSARIAAVLSPLVRLNGHDVRRLTRRYIGGGV